MLALGAIGLLDAVRQHPTLLWSEEANRIYTDNRCDEGKYGLLGLLRSARTEDKTFVEARGPNPAEICTFGCSEKVSTDEEETGDEFHQLARSYVVDS